MDSFDPDNPQDGLPDSSEEAPVEVPWQHLSREALTGVVESCLVAQLADQNVEGFELQREVTKILAGLEAGDWILVYDPQTESPVLRQPADF